MADTTEEPTMAQRGESGVVHNNNISETLITDLSGGEKGEESTIDKAMSMSTPLQSSAEAAAHSTQFQSSAKESTQPQSNSDEPTKLQTSAEVSESSQSASNAGESSQSESNAEEQPLADTVVSSAQSASAHLQEIADRALRFLSHASNETIGACLVGLGATTYLVLGRVGLMLIGLVGGIALHASWDAHGESNKAAAREKELKKRRELGLEVAQRVFRWKSEKAFAEDDSKEEEVQIAPLALTKKKLDFSTFQPETAAALTAFTDAVIRDYVKWWYAPVLPGEDSFPETCRQTLIAFLISLSNRLSRKRPVDAFLDFVTNSSSIVIVFLNELSAALNASPNSPAHEAVATYLDIKPDSALANVLDQKLQERKLALVADDILQNYLDKKAYECLPVQMFLKQVLAKLVLSMTIDTCSRPEWINGWIVYLLEDGEPELMNAIDAGVEKAVVPQPKNDDKRASIANTTTTKSPEQDAEKIAHHKRTRSRAENAMDEAMREAQRLTQLIAEEDAQREKQRESMTISRESISESTTDGIVTPNSSHSSSSRNDDTGLRSPIDVSPTSQKPAIKDTPTSPTLQNSAMQDTPTSIETQQFTSFDRMMAVKPATALSPEADKERLKPVPVLTLHNAKISIFDDSMPGEKANIKSKPTTEYMIQIEPADSRFPGWMIVRKYADFETLHEVLRRISNIAGVGFNEAHPNLPAWKVHTKASLRGELERYLCDAARYQQLAESEGMKRFLEKDQGLNRSPGGTKGFGWPTPVAFDQMGKSMIDVLTKAPKEVAGSGKSFFGGVAGVLGGKKGHASTPSQATNRSSLSLSQNYMEDSYMGSIGFDGGRQSTDSLRSLPSIQRKTSVKSDTPLEARSRPSISSRNSLYGRQSTDIKRSESRSSSIAGLQSPHTPIEEKMNLPPLPSEISEDYGSPARFGVEAEQPSRRGEGMTYSNPASRRTSSHNLVALAEESPSTPSRPTTSGKDMRPTSSRREKSPTPSLAPSLAPSTAPSVAVSKQNSKAKPPITEQETQVAVELLFAVITELYTISSAWQIRRTLLNAAKTFLLRPGNPQLEAIRILIQESVIDANTSDSGIAAQINTVRAAGLPTEEELKKWPKELRDEEKEQLRVKARKLLVERGMPVALTGVMGQAATGEALGRVFDSLQDAKVARGLVFGLILQGLRGVVQ